MRCRLYGASLLAMAVAFSARAEPSHGIEEVVVTAQKRSEKLQKVPMSVQVLDGKKLEQLQITEFQDYIKYLPSVTAQTLGPNQTTIYMRGISSGDNANHSGPLPTVGSYLDEMPITTIGGTLDVHVYDMSRIEVLPGPQGTLYGASSAPRSCGNRSGSGGQARSCGFAHPARTPPAQPRAAEPPRRCSFGTPFAKNSKNPSPRLPKRIAG